MVILSDENPCTVRKLGLYELDSIPGPAVYGPFTYERKIGGGKVHEIEYVLPKEPPEKPGVPESNVKEKSIAWYDWREFNLYQAAITYERKRLDSNAGYVERCTQYILHNCIDTADIIRIVTEEDWRKVYTAAVVQQLTKQKVVETLRQFKASYSKKEIFDAFEKAAKGRGEYDAIKVWEGKLMIAMGLTEAAYCLMSLDERARKVVAHNLDDWLGHLEMDRAKKEFDAANG